LKHSPLILFFSLSTLLASGQSLPERKVIHRNVLWLTLNSSFRFQGNWGILADMSHRRSDLARENDLSLVRIAGAYWIKPNLFVAGGYAHLWSTLNTGSQSIDLNENRLYQQVNLVLKWKKNFLTQRVRLEERWREGSLNGRPSGKFDYTTRYRYLLGLRRPLGNAKKSPSLVFADEIMLQSGPAVDHGIFEQNRIFGGLNLRFSEKLSLETGYMYTWQKALNGFTYTSIHTIRMTLSFEWQEKPHKVQLQIPPVTSHH
jgi:outer membrane receptor protein involved in Fe transport